MKTHQAGKTAADAYQWTCLDALRSEAHVWHMTKKGKSSWKWQQMLASCCISLIKPCSVLAWQMQGNVGKLLMYLAHADQLLFQTGQALLSANLKYVRQGQLVALVEKVAMEACQQKKEDIFDMLKQTAWMAMAICPSVSGNGWP